MALGEGWGTDGFLPSGWFALACTGDTVILGKGWRLAEYLPKGWLAGSQFVPLLSVCMITSSSDCAIVSCDIFDTSI